MDGFSTAMGLRFSTAYLTYPPRLHKKVTMHVSSLKALRRFESGWRVEGCGGGEAGVVARGAGGVTAEHAESVPCNTHRGWPLALR